MDFVGIEKLSLVDYDGKISCILFTEKCNFRCPFCHNAPLVIGENNKAIPFDDILKYLKLRIHILDGVVISGGEPTLMPDLIEKLIAIKKLGYPIKLDTNGTNPKLVKHLITNKLIDYVAMDIKNSQKEYAKTVGLNSLNFDAIKESIDYLKENHVPYEFRTTLVDELHSETSIRELGELIEGANILVLQKFVASETCIKQNLHPVSEEVAKKYQSILEKYIKTVKLRGY